MLKILAKCLKSSLELNEMFWTQQILETCSANDLRTISGKKLII